MFTARTSAHTCAYETQVETLTNKLLDSEIYVLGWQSVNFTAKVTPFTTVVDFGSGNRLVWLWGFRPVLGLLGSRMMGLVRNFPKVL